MLICAKFFFLRKKGFALNLVLKQEFLELEKHLRYWYLNSRVLDFAIFARQCFAGFCFCDLAFSALLRSRRFIVFTGSG